MTKTKNEKYGYLYHFHFFVPPALCSNDIWESLVSLPFVYLRLNYLPFASSWTNPIKRVPAPKRNIIAVKRVKE